MYLSSAQIKGKIKNIAKQNHSDPITLLRIYMMERFLERIAFSKYRDCFIVKGGILVTSMIGISLRSTMDIDTTIRNFNLNEEKIYEIITEIKDIKLEDNIEFELLETSNIMDNMDYPEIRIHMNSAKPQPPPAPAPPPAAGARPSSRRRSPGGRSQIRRKSGHHSPAAHENNPAFSMDASSRILSPRFIRLRQRAFFFRDSDLGRVLREHLLHDLHGGDDHVVTVSGNAQPLGGGVFLRHAGTGPEQLSAPGQSKDLLKAAAELLCLGIRLHLARLVSAFSVGVQKAQYQHGAADSAAQLLMAAAHTAAKTTGKRHQLLLRQPRQIFEGASHRLGTVISSFMIFIGDCTAIHWSIPPILIVIQYVYCVFTLQFFRQIHQLAQPVVQTGLGHGRVKFLRQL